MASDAYIERLKQVIFHLHKADSIHLESVPVHEVFRGQTVWQGVVEVFELVRHPKATRAYAWSHRSGQNDSGERFVVVLGLPPVNSPVAAVKVAIVSEARQKMVDRKSKPK